MSEIQDDLSVDNFRKNGIARTPFLLCHHADTMLAKSLTTPTRIVNYFYS